MQESTDVKLTKETTKKASACKKPDSSTESAESKRRRAQIKPPSMPKWGMETVRFVGLSLSRLLFRIKYLNKENIPQKRPGGLLICANHQSYFDPFWIGFPIKRPMRYMAWDAATRWFLVGSFIRALGAYPVNIERASKESLIVSVGWLKSGGTLMLFPEGSRSLSNGKMLDFKNGAVRIALQAGVPILPVTVRGGNRVWAQNMHAPRLSKVKIIYHPLMEVPPVPENCSLRAHVDDLTTRLAVIIGSALPEENAQN